MSTLQIRALNQVDRALQVLLVVVLTGSIVAFGTQVWWAPPLFGGVTLTLALLAVLRGMLLGGGVQIRKSPWGPIGALALVLGLVQLAPLPAALASRLSPRSQALYSVGFVPEMVQGDDPDRELPAVIDVVRSPVTLDRPATLRWMLGAIACLAVFGVTSSVVDRVRLFHGVTGAVIAGLLVNATFGLLQIAGGSGGLYGILRPGSAPSWAPSTADLLASPVPAVLRPVGGGASTPWANLSPRPVFLLGSLLGGPGAFLALASLGLPLAFGTALHLVAPRGSRESIATRLGESGRASLVGLLLGLVLVGGGMVGFLGGPILAAPFALSLAVIGLASIAGTGLGRTALLATTMALAAIGAGLGVSAVLERPEGSSALASPASLPMVRQSWIDAAKIARDFPVLGAGLGAFPSIASNYKDRDATTTAEQSALSRWTAETGLAGLALLGLGLLWFAVRIPGALIRVGSADRALAYGLLGAVLCFGMISALHWTVEIGAVALAAAALLGMTDRWLAGATDLFVERA